MTTPTILADTAGNAKVDRSGAVRSIHAQATVPNTTAADTIIGMIRFQKGFTLDQLAIKSSDIDAGTTVLIDVGYVYDDDTTYTNDPNAFFDGLDIGQDAGSRVWPVADGLLTGVGFTAEADGYITVQLTDDAAEADGTIDVKALFSYDG